MNSARCFYTVCATTLISALVILCFCLGSVFATNDSNYDDNRLLITNVFSKAHVSGSLIRSSTCKSDHVHRAHPLRVQEPHAIGSTLQIVRQMFAIYPKIVVTQDQDGIIRIVESGVPTDILAIKIHHISFDDEHVEHDASGPSFRGPNMAWSEIWQSPEVNTFLKEHHIGPNTLEIPANASDSALPVVSGEVNDVTVSQALDYILKFAPGYWVYENCTNEDGGREVFFWFY